MGQVLHGSATTTEAIRRAIQHSQASLRALSGTIGNSVCGRRVAHQAAMARVKRSPKMTANWALAMVHSRGGIFHSFPERFKIR